MPVFVLLAMFSNLMLIMQKLINERCRKLSKRVSFYTVDCRDCCGEIFVDLQKYNYAMVNHLLPFHFCRFSAFTLSGCNWIMLIQMFLF